MGQHALLPPSSAHQWSQCAQSAQMLWTYPDMNDTAEAAEGTAAHWVASSVLESYRGDDALLSTDSLIGSYDPAGVLVTEEMADSARVYVNHALSVVQQHGALQSMHIEERVSCAKSIHPQVWGTPDLWFYSEEYRYLYVYDFKHGHLPVEAYENWQLIAYVAGILESLELDDQNTTVTMTVVQPRAFHRHGAVRQHTTVASNLRATLNTMHNRANEAFGNHPAARAGTHCRNCPGRHACEALKLEAMAALDYVTYNVPEEMTPEATAIERAFLTRAQDAIKARLSGIDAQIMHKGGVPGWSIERGHGRRKWSKDVTPESLIAIGQSYNIDLQKPQLITPTQAEKAGMAEDVMHSLSYRPVTEPKIVRSTDTVAARVFSKK